MKKLQWTWDEGTQWKTGTTISISIYYIFKLSSNPAQKQILSYCELQMFRLVRVPRTSLKRSILHSSSSSSSNGRTQQVCQVIDADRRWLTPAQLVHNRQTRCCCWLETDSISLISDVKSVAGFKLKSVALAAFRCRTWSDSLIKKNQTRISGVTRVGVTRSGNWRCHYSFPTKTGDLFSHRPLQSADPF